MNIHELSERVWTMTVHHPASHPSWTCLCTDICPLFTVQPHTPAERVCVQTSVHCSPSSLTPQLNVSVYRHLSTVHRPASHPSWTCLCTDICPLFTVQPHTPAERVCVQTSVHCSPSGLTPQLNVSVYRHLSTVYRPASHPSWTCLCTDICRLFTVRPHTPAERVCVQTSVDCSPSSLTPQLNVSVYRHLSTVHRPASHPSWTCLCTDICPLFTVRPHTTAERVCVQTSVHCSPSGLTPQLNVSVYRHLSTVHRAASHPSWTCLCICWIDSLISATYLVLFESGGSVCIFWLHLLTVATPCTKKGQR